MTLAVSMGPKLTHRLLRVLPSIQIVDPLSQAIAAETSGSSAAATPEHFDDSFEPWSMKRQVSPYSVIVWLSPLSCFQERTVRHTPHTSPLLRTNSNHLCIHVYIDLQGILNKYTTNERLSILGLDDSDGKPKVVAQTSTMTDKVTQPLSLTHVSNCSYRTAPIVADSASVVSPG
jgi:hypothetical protein